MGMPDNGIPEEVLEHAKCVAVVPHMVKGGFIFGGKGGKGVATCRTANGWSAPAFITISGGSWGLQIGVEAVDLVMIIQNEKGMQKLLSSNFQVGADASAAAGPVGRHASAGTDWKMDTEILTYSRAKGAFAGLTLEGASIRQDNDSRHAIYGRKVTTRALLLGKVPAPSAAQPFLAEIRGAKAQAVAEGKAEAKEKEQAVGMPCLLEAGVYQTRVRRKGKEGNMLGTILIVVLVLALLGALPRWPHSRDWGYYPTGGVGLVLLIGRRSSDSRSHLSHSAIGDSVMKNLTWIGVFCWFSECCPLSYQSLTARTTE